MSSGALGETATWYLAQRMFVPMLFALIELGGITITSEVSCPPTASVVTEVRRLLGEEGSFAPLTVQLREEEGTVFLERRDSRRGVTARRRLEGASCEDRARIAAIAIAAWTIPEAPLVDDPAPANNDAAPAPVESDATPEPVVVRVGPGSRPRRRLAIEGSIGFFGAYERTGFAPGAAAELSLGEQRSGWAGRVGFLGTGPRSSDFSSGIGSVAWERYALYLGARYRFVKGSWRFDLGSDLLFGLVHLAGRGFEANTNVYGFDFGLGGGVRVSRAWQRVAPFVSLSVVGWVVEYTATIGNSRRTTTIPTVDGTVSVGVSFANF